MDFVDMFAFLAASTVAASRPMRSAAATAVIDLSQPFAARPAIAGLLKLDVTSDEDVVAAARAAGNVNLLVNNAGIARAWATDNSHARPRFRGLRAEEAHGKGKADDL
jgi:NAD(P)-dependent dehydrogenase (short-subunit alcohol dehydrogenase family)